MALEAEKRYLDRKEIVVDRSMRIMTVTAVIHIVSMLEHKGALFVAMALHTGFLQR
jgi:hypothetical protein